MRYEVMWTEDAARERDALAPEELEAVNKVVETIAADPNAPGSHPLVGDVRQVVIRNNACLTYVVVRGMLFIVVMQLFTDGM